MKKSSLFFIFVYVVSTSFFIPERTSEGFKKVEQTTSHNTPPSQGDDHQVAALYDSIDFSGFQPLTKEVFAKAYQGYTNLKKAGRVNESSCLLTICDFSLSSKVKRLWVIDLKQKKIIFNSLVAHGRATGDEFAEAFSNRESSHQSSLGFYITENAYNGSNGYSLKLEGVDAGYNDAAYKRAIVVHGADYVNEDFIIKQKRIGRSWGCPAVPRHVAVPLIDTIKDKNVLFIYYPDQGYFASSQWLNNSDEDMTTEKPILANN
ncbi:hypothetical protein GNY06_04330 [Elizabethkingia argentiflava]|uniref:L,D-transpeptidase catalytic domain n=1 Tax=Elizabethkingia argenteiflava TaxID=2681556 RepID=A0A845PSL3_9FLAO|nr:murein L,D-transpeptidase catalytic domain family protein [Elizabethkingia argenteiflava]NAW50645.1 hypothetical protein [Elizabethkingia argenteiflava]